MNIYTLLRALPPFRGKLRIARLLRKKDGTDLMFESSYGKFILPHLNDNQYLELYTNGKYETHLIDFIISNLPEKGTFLDIGGNIGAICIPVAKARPDINIISIEALPLNYAYLIKNIENNNIKNILPLNICCSDSEAKIIRFYFEDSMNGNSSFHSLHTTNFIELETHTIDKELEKLKIDKVDLLKIDTEGSEAMIFKGGTKLLGKMRPKIVFEFIDVYENAIPGLKAGDAQQILLDNNYTLYSFDNTLPLKHKLVKGGGEFLALPE